LISTTFHAGVQPPILVRRAAVYIWRKWRCVALRGKSKQDVGAVRLNLRKLHWKMREVSGESSSLKVRNEGKCRLKENLAYHWVSAVPRLHGEQTSLFR
jgi:hypothetical protein